MPALTEGESSGKSRDVQGSLTLGGSEGVLAYDRRFFPRGGQGVNFFWRNAEKSCFGLIWTKLTLI